MKNAPWKIIALAVLIVQAYVTIPYNFAGAEKSGAVALAGQAEDTLSTAGNIDGLNARSISSIR